MVYIIDKLFKHNSCKKGDWLAYGTPSKKCVSTTRRHHQCVSWGIRRPAGLLFTERTPVRLALDSVAMYQSRHSRTWIEVHSSVEDSPFMMGAEDDWDGVQHRGRTEYNGRLTPEGDDLKVGRVLAGARGMICDNAPMRLCSADTSTHPHSKVTRRGRLTY